MSIESRLTRIKESLLPRTKLDRTVIAREMVEKGFVILPKDTRVRAHVWTTTRTDHINMRLEQDHEVTMEKDGVFVLDSQERRRVKQLYEDTTPTTDIVVAANKLALPEERGRENRDIDPIVKNLAAYFVGDIVDRELTTNFLLKEPEIGERYDAMQVREVFLATKLVGKSVNRRKSK